MNIALIDNDFVSRKNHNFPNLALMKISAYHKSKGSDVNLIGFNEINPNTLFSNNYDEIIISKAFTDSHTPDYIFNMSNVKKGGTGFYFDKADPLPYDIEHSKPDYNLYKHFYNLIKKKDFFIDYSIGYTTRGCFRKCDFCVNRNSNKVLLHSPIDEFYDSSKKKIALLDDNILGLPNKDLFKIFDRFEDIDKRIQYRQGMDIRLLTPERVDRLLRLKYDSAYYFAFDNWVFKDQIEKKLRLFSEKIQLIKPDRKWINTKLYVFSAFDYENKYDVNFWLNDIEMIFKRFEIIFKYKALPFLMRFEKWNESPFREVYINIAQWCNMPQTTIMNLSFNEWIDTGSIVSPKTKEFRDKYPRFRKIFDLKF